MQLSYYFMREENGGWVRDDRQPERAAVKIVTLQERHTKIQGLVLSLCENQREEEGARSYMCGRQ